MSGKNVYAYVKPETLRALHFYMGVGGAERFLSDISEAQWVQANELAITRVKQFCKCQGTGCMACKLAIEAT